MEIRTQITLILPVFSALMRSTLPFDKPKQFVPVKNPLATMTMAPSSTQMRDSVSDAVEAVGSADTVSPTPHVEEPLLYLMPSELHPTYRPLPVFVQFVVVLLSAWASAVTTWKHLTFIQPLAVVRGLRSSPSLGKMFAFFGKVSQLIS